MKSRSRSQFVATAGRACLAAPLWLGLAGCTANARFDLSNHQAETTKSGAGAPSQFPAEPVQPKGNLGWSARRSRADTEFANEVVVVRDGDTLHAIAARHNVTVPMLFSANGLLSDRITPGQHIIVPKRVSGAPGTAPE